MQTTISNKRWRRYNDNVCMIFMMVLNATNIYVIYFFITLLCVFGCFGRLALLSPQTSLWSVCTPAYINNCAWILLYVVWMLTREREHVYVSMMCINFAFVGYLQRKYRILHNIWWLYSFLMWIFAFSPSPSFLFNSFVCSKYMMVKMSEFYFVYCSWLYIGAVDDGHFTAVPEIF